LKRIIPVLFFLLPLIAQAQTFKSYGLNFGTTFENFGWTHPDTSYHSYHEKPHTATYFFGIFGEFFSKKYYSTKVDLAVRSRQYTFEYDVNNPNGAGEPKNTIDYLTLTVSEKLRLDINAWSFYLFGGIRGDFQFHKSIGQDFQNVFGGSKSVLFGLNTGVGIAKRFSKFWRVSFDLYYDPDILKLYNSSLGNVRNSEFGFKFGIGLYNPANK
jgi:hypothetical protein